MSIWCQINSADGTTCKIAVSWEKAWVVKAEKYAIETLKNNS